MALQGTIDSFPVVDVLGLLAASAKTGCLELTGDRGQGSVWLRDGSIVAGGVQGHPTSNAADVVFELLLFEEASFEFLVGEEAHSPDFSSTVPDAVEQAQQMLQDWQDVREVVPEVSMSVGLVAEIDDEEVTLSATEWSLLARCGTAATVAGLLEELGLGEFEGCSRLADLVGRGLVELALVPEVAGRSGDATQRSLVPDEVVPASNGQHAVADPQEIPLAERFPEKAPDAPPLDRDRDLDRDGDLDRGADLADDDPMPEAPRPPLDTGVVGQAVPPAAFPEHFPIDDLVGSEEQVSFDGPPGVSGAPQHAPSFSGEPAAPASEHTAREAFDDPAGGFGHNGAEPQTGPYAEAHMDPDAAAPNDDVLAQIGRLSPKAAEAIAAALGDGEGS